MTRARLQLAPRLPHGLLELPTSPGLAWPRAREPHHLGPLLCFVGDELAELGGRGEQHRGAKLVKPLFDAGICKRGVNFTVELGNGLGWSVFLGTQTPSIVLAS